MREEILTELNRRKEDDYRAFSQKLLPGVENILGVRLPALRALAKRAAKADAAGYLAQMQAWCADAGNAVSFEEKMIYGMVIGYAKMTDNEYKERLDAFIPLIDNWSVCDSCCITYKWMGKNREFWWERLSEWAFSGTEYGARFALVCMLDYFVDEAYLERLFHTAGSIRQEGYYAKMAAAWLLSVCFMQFPEETYGFLKERQLDGFIWKKAVQKSCESYRVSAAWKRKLRELRGGQV